MKKLVVIAMAALFTAGAYAADVAIPTSAKHKQDCTMCHQDGFKPVPTEKCLTCHADINKGSYTLANGKENPHVSIHYLPETVDCNLCHREHGKSQNYTARPVTPTGSVSRCRNLWMSGHPPSPLARDWTQNAPCGSLGLQGRFS